MVSNGESIRESSMLYEDVERVYIVFYSSTSLDVSARENEVKGVVSFGLGKELFLELVAKGRPCVERKADFHMLFEQVIGKNVRATFIHVRQCPKNHVCV